MKRLLTLDPNERLGSGGAEEVKAHAFFAGIDWDKVTASEAAFIPQVTDPESTDYFDPRGAIPQLFHDDELIPSLASEVTTVLQQAPRCLLQFQSPWPVAKGRPRAAVTILAPSASRTSPY
jgi:hypothetical protein